MQQFSIWEDSIEITQLFDPNNTQSRLEDQEYLYDPDGDTQYADCYDITEKNCKNWWGSKRRSQDIAFNERKMLRLAFHDCFLYEDGTGGCDGCLNLNSDENLDDNDGLQFTVAVLEKLYTDKDFPSAFTS